MMSEDKPATQASMFQTVVLSLIPALIIGMSSSYLTAQVTLAKFETEQAHLSTRLARVESENALLRDSLNSALSELRVLNERMKQVDTVALSQQRLETKVDALLIQTPTPNRR